MHGVRMNIYIYIFIYLFIYSVFFSVILRAELYSFSEQE